MIDINRLEQPDTLNKLLHACGAVTSLTAILLVFFFIHRPVQLECTKREHQTTDSTRLLSDSDKIHAENIKLSQELSETESQLATMVESIPVFPDESVFLGQLTKVAQKTGLSIHDYRPGTAIEQTTHSELEVSLSADGSYENLCRFLQALDQIPRMFTVTQLKVLAPSALDKKQSIMMTFRIYFAPMDGFSADVSEDSNA